jgi:bifunctional NMN adenylyltransferase/nudix hydrolase
MVKKVGVIVARFQVAALHQGHRNLIEYALSQCERVLIVLGIPGSLPTNRNPLEFSMREAMVREAYPAVEIVGLNDQLSDEYWSKTLDLMIEERCHGCDVILYGSRDSFFSAYSGHLKIEEFASLCGENGTSAREQIAGRRDVTPDFRAGIIYREETRMPHIYVTVDVAVINEQGEVLLAGKEREQGKLCFIGGFVDVSDASLVAAASRELYEEAGGIEVGGESGFVYVGSTLIDDWRYNGSKDCVMTNFFVTTYLFGAPQPSDDIDSLQWVPIEKIGEVLTEYHLPLAKMLKAHMTK